MFDNGKISISMFGGVPLIEVYHNGELNLGDIEWVNNIVLHELSPMLKPTMNIIIDRKGNYSLSKEALANMKELMKVTNCVAYIVYSSIQENVVRMARSIYLSGKQVETFHSISAAHLWLGMNHSLAMA